MRRDGEKKHTVHDRQQDTSLFLSLSFSLYLSSIFPPHHSLPEYPSLFLFHFHSHSSLSLSIHLSRICSHTLLCVETNRRKEEVIAAVEQHGSEKSLYQKKSLSVHHIIPLTFLSQHVRPVSSEPVNQNRLGSRSRIISTQTKEDNQA